MKMARLGDVCEIRIGRTPSRANPSYWNGSHPWATISDLSGDTVTSTREGITDAAIQELRLRPVEAGTLLYSFKLTIGKMAVAERDLFTNEAIAALSPRDPSRLDSQYLRYALASVDPTAGASIAVKGRTLNSATLADLAIPVADIEMQRRIVAGLAARTAVVEEARSATMERAGRISSLRARVLERAFRATRERASTQAIGTVARIQTGYAFKSEWFRASGERLLRNVNIGHRSINWEDTANLDPGMVGQFGAFRLRAGDVVLSLDRPLVGSGIKVARVGPADLPALLLQRVARFITCPSLDAAFLYFFLLSGAFVDAIGGHDQSLGVPHVSPRQVGAVLIPLPSVGEQRRIAGSLHERLATIDAMTAAVGAQLAAMQALRSALLRVVFDGASA
jgi:type I restriction enzyme S subunit